MCRHSSDQRGTAGYSHTGLRTAQTGIQMTELPQLSYDATDLIRTVTHIVGLDGSPWSTWMVGTYSKEAARLFERTEIKSKGVGEAWFGKAKNHEEAMEVVRLLVGKGCKLDDKTDGVGSHLYFVRREKRPHDSGDRSPYSSVDHVREAGRRIVEDYARHKSVTKRRADRGGKAEELVRAALRAVLPEWIGVEHGFVVDSYGFTSLQQDVVLFERMRSPVFRTVTDGAGSGNFPCECVIATGEVKAGTYSGWVRDVFQKSESAKRMRRSLGHEETSGTSWFPWRHYGDRSRPTEDQVRGPIFDQDRNPRDRIMTFGIALESGNKAHTIARQVANEISQQERALGPDTIVVLQRGVIEGRRVVKESDKVTRMEIFGLQDHEPTLTSMQEWDESSRIWDPFSYLVTKIVEHALCGRTASETSLLRYMTRMGWAASGFRDVTYPINRSR